MKRSLLLLPLIIFPYAASAVNDEKFEYVEYPNGTVYVPLDSSGEDGSTVATADGRTADCYEEEKECRELLEEAYESGEPVTVNPAEENKKDKKKKKKKKKKASAQIAEMSDQRIRSLTIDDLMKLSANKKLKVGDKDMLKRIFSN